MKKKSVTTKEDYQSDVLDLTRKILDGVQLKNLNWPLELKGEERLKFLRFCNTVASEPYFEIIIAGIYQPSLEQAALRSENYDVITFNRATCNGVSLVQEFFGKWARIYVEEFEKNRDDFDPNKSFEPVDEGK